MATSTADGLTIPSPLPLPINRFLNARNTTALQSDCDPTYVRKILYFPTAFYKDLFQGKTLDMTDSNAPTGLSSLLTPPSLSGPENLQRRAMQVQFLVTMCVHQISKEETGELLDQRVHMVNKTQDTVSRKNYTQE